ncbi:MAG: hypothetical protein HQK96_19550 [Nitrospirae bacterium]|nr:hypothetical protein [Nitrospirota bacterium]
MMKTKCPGCNKEIIEGDAVTFITFSSKAIDVGFSHDEQKIGEIIKPPPKKGEFFDIFTYSLGFISVWVIPDGFVDRQPGHDLAFVLCSDACAAKVHRAFESELTTH